MFTHEQFQALYDQLNGDQTLDDNGAPLDCGVQCDKFCCRPGNTSKYLLPGERNFIESEISALGGEMPFSFTNLMYLEMVHEPEHRACACEPYRALRTFNCRIFPYSPKLESRRVVDLKKSKLKYLEPCWISVPASKWRDAAIAAWQMVLDDVDNRILFARLCTLWEWNQAVERGEDAGHALVALASLDVHNDDEVWARTERFFSRKDG
jgi:hypothetical protein